MGELEGETDFITNQSIISKILQDENELQEIVQLVGQDSLAEGEKITLEVAKMIKEDWLQQDAFSEYDPYCPFYKSSWMFRNFAKFYELANKAVEGGTSQKISLDTIKA